MITSSPRWDFSKKQWGNILGSVKGLKRADVSREAWARIEEIWATSEGAGECPDWLKTARTDLLNAVNWYLSSVESERAPAARIGKWTKVVRRAVELRKAIRALDDPRDRLILDQIEEETKVKADEFLRSLRAAAGGQWCGRSAKKQTTRSSADRQARFCTTTCS
jgi:hypothetical protein